MSPRQWIFDPDSRGVKIKAIRQLRPSFIFRFGLAAQELEKPQVLRWEFSIKTRSGASSDAKRVSQIPLAFLNAPHLRILTPHPFASDVGSERW